MGRSTLVAVTTLLALVDSLSANIAYASDWQYAGYTKAGTVESHQFFDAQSISRPTKDVTRVWVKSIRLRTLDRYAKTHQKSVVEKTAQKIAVYYSPKFLELPAIGAKYTEEGALQEMVVMLTSYEVMANTPDIQTQHRFYFEIDCAGKRMRMLDGHSFDARGELSSKSTRRPEDFSFIAPDSNGEWLSMMVCPAK